MCTDLPGCIVAAYDAGNGVRIESVNSRGGKTRWAVRDAFGLCLGRDGLWRDEPSASSRTEEFLNVHRFGSPQEALQVLRAVSQLDAEAGGREIAEAV